MWGGFWQVNGISYFEDKEFKEAQTGLGFIVIQALNFWLPFWSGQCCLSLHTGRLMEGPQAAAANFHPMNLPV